MCKKRKLEGERRRNDPDYRRKQSKLTTYWNKKLNKADKMLKALNKPENREHQRQRARESKREFWSNAKNRENMSYNKTVEIDTKICEMFINYFIKYGYPKRDDLFKKINSDPDNTLMDNIRELNEGKYLSTSLNKINK
ncbi:MAG: hypothetical protein ACOCP4_06225 [Candidatus Woesearchaeota archaeon]